MPSGRIAGQRRGLSQAHSLSWRGCKPCRSGIAPAIGKMQGSIPMFRGENAFSEKTHRDGANAPSLSICRKTQGAHKRASGRTNSNRGRRRERRPRARIFPWKKSLPCRFCGRNPQDFSKIWRGWPWRWCLLPRPPACQKDFFGQAEEISYCEPKLS